MPRPKPKKFKINSYSENLISDIEHISIGKLFFGEGVKDINSLNTVLKDKKNTIKAKKYRKYLLKRNKEILQQCTLDSIDRDKLKKILQLKHIPRTFYRELNRLMEYHVSENVNKKPSVKQIKATLTNIKSLINSHKISHIEELYKIIREDEYTENLIESAFKEIRRASKGKYKQTIYELVCISNIALNEFCKIILKAIKTVEKKYLEVENNGRTTEAKINLAFQLGIAMHEHLNIQPTTNAPMSFAKNEPVTSNNQNHKFYDLVHYIFTKIEKKKIGNIQKDIIVPAVAFLKKRCIEIS